MSDVKQGVLDAIYNPIGCESIDKIIKPGDTVAFICNDPTRVANSYDFMPVLVNDSTSSVSKMRICTSSSLWARTAT